MFGAVLHHREHVGQYLGGVELVGQTVPHRHSGVPAEDLHVLLREPPVLDAVVHAAEHAGGVFHRLFVPDLRAAGLQVGHLGTLIVRGHLERRAGTRRGLLED